MAIITKPSIAKGAPATLTLNVADLIAHSAITDAYFQDYTNLARVEMIWKSNPGNQHETVKFDVSSIPSAATPVTGTFSLSAKARDTHEIQRVKLVDKDGGTFVIERSQLTAADFDVSLGAQGGGAGGASLPAAGLAAHYSADYGVYSDAGVTESTANGDVYGWKDKVTNNVLSWQSGPAVLRTTQASTGLAVDIPALEIMNWISDADLPSAFNLSSYSVWVVGKNNNANNGSVFLGNNDGSSYLYAHNNTPSMRVLSGGTVFDAGTGVPANTWAIMGIQSDSANSSNRLILDAGGTAYDLDQAGRQNGVELNQAMPIQITSFFRYISSDYSLYGGVAEIIIYNRALSGEEVDQVKSYLKTRYGI